MAQEAIINIGEKLKVTSGIIRPDAADVIVNSAYELREGNESVRAKAYASSVSSNAGIVMLAGAAIAAIPAIGAAVFGAAGGLSGGALALIGVEGLKKSKPFLLTSKIVSEAVDSLSDADIKSILAVRSKQLRPLLKFVMKNQSSLHQLAGDSKQLAWLHSILDWLEANKDHLK